MLKYETDSRLVKDNQIFVALKGHQVDGHEFIEDAFKNGAKKAIVEKNLRNYPGVTTVTNTYEYLVKHLTIEYAYQFSDLKFIGITGTNGKTTTCYLVYQLLNFFKQNACYIGTIGFYYNDYYESLNNTTPDILTLYKLIFKAKEMGAKIIVMEVSSHALEQRRLAGIKLDIAAFTNLTQDHLDYHKNMNNYLNAKLKIIDLLKDNAPLIINNDDSYSHYFKIKHNNCFNIGKNDSKLKIIDYTFLNDKTKIKFKINNNFYESYIPLVGEFNVYNYLFAISIVNLLGIDIKNIINQSFLLKAPKGRCQTINYNNNIIVIDYAHTPDAVLKIIDNYQQLPHNKIITIIGCGGNRDSKKRPLMGSIATTKSDFTIFTNDNPRYEKPKKIMKDIIKDLINNNYKIIYNRKKAIYKGIKLLKQNDILLILGKGHEDYQIIKQNKKHFSDYEVVKSFI